MNVRDHFDAGPRWWFGAALLTSAFVAGAVTACGAGATSSDTPDSGSPDSNDAGGSAVDSGSAGSDAGAPQGSPDAGAVATDAGADADEICATPDGGCTVAPQCGCAVSETCDFTSDTVAACIRSTGSAGIQTECKVTADCAPGLVCEWWDGWTVNRGICSTPSTAGATLAPCPLEVRPGFPDAGVGFSSAVDTADGGVLFYTCQPHCEMAKQTGCKAGMQCDHFGFGAVNVASCRPSNSLPLGTPCDDKNDLCAPGLFCGDTDHRCYAWCRVSENPSDCAHGSCTKFDRPWIVDSTEYGYCSM